MASVLGHAFEFYVLLGNEVVFLTLKMTFHTYKHMPRLPCQAGDSGLVCTTAEPVSGSEGRGQSARLSQLPENLAV